MNRDSTAKDIMRWRVVLLSSGERALETYIAPAGFDHKAGQWVRIIDLPLKGAFGIFDDLHGEKSAARFADKLRNNAACCYGHAGPAFVEGLTKELPTFSLSEKLNSLVATCTEPLSAQQGRVWRAFAVEALAGELASLWEILPWNTGTALSSATQLVKHWLTSQPQSAASREQAQIFKSINDFVDTHLDSRFSNLDWTPSTNQWGNVIEAPVIRDRAGYWRDEGGKRIIMFTPAGLRAATKGHDFGRVIQAIEEAGAFTKIGANQKSVPTRIPQENRVVTLYYVDLSKLRP